MPQPITQANAYFNPETFPMEVFGFIEELIEITEETNTGFRLLGTRKLDSLPTRPMGAPGLITVEIRENVTLIRGMKQVVVKASAESPRQCYSMLHAICGRVK